MKNPSNKRRFFRMAVAGISLCALAVFSSAVTASTTSTSVNIVNNSNSEIRNVYLSHVDADDWSANQLAEGATIAPGASSALNNLACDQQQIKVIAEDSDGCFLSTVVTCGNSNTWTITNDTAKDCGGGY